MAQAQVPDKVFLLPTTTVALPVVEGEQVVYEVELTSLNNDDISAIENCEITYEYEEDQTVNEEDNSKHEEKDPDYNEHNVAMASRYECIQKRGTRGRKKKEGDDLKCDICGKQYTKLKQLTVHKKYHSDERPYICSVVGCGMAFKLSNGLSRHMRSHTKYKPYKCSQCDKCFSQSGARTLHERRHNGVRPYKCQVCGHSFVQKSSLTYHMIKHMEDRKYQCEECGSKFKHKKAVERHKKQHRPKEYQCEFCFREYVEKYDWQQHLKKCKFRDNPVPLDLNKKDKTPLANVEDKKLIANIEELLAEAANKEDVKVTDTREKPHLCSICGKRFLTSTHLRQHMRSHQDKAVLGNLCDYCGKMFRNKMSLAEHIRIHTGESPYECSICKQTFQTIGKLNNHFRNHFDDKPFQCKLCHASFKKKEAVIRHMHIHLNDSPNNCEFCNKPSGDRRAKLAHYRVHFERLFQKAKLNKPIGANPDNYIQILYHLLKKINLIQTIETDNNKNPLYVYNDVDYAEIEKIFKEIVDALGREPKRFNNPLALKDLHKIGVIQKDMYIFKPIIQKAKKDVKKEQITETNSDSPESENEDEHTTDKPTETENLDNNHIENKSSINTDNVTENNDENTISLRRSARKRKPKEMFDNTNTKKKVTLFSLLTKRKYSIEQDTKSSQSETRNETSDDSKNRTDNISSEESHIIGEDNGRDKDGVSQDNSSLQGESCDLSLPGESCDSSLQGESSNSSLQGESSNWTLQVESSDSSLQEAFGEKSLSEHAIVGDNVSTSCNEESFGDMYIQEAGTFHVSDLEDQSKPKTNDLEDHLEKESRKGDNTAGCNSNEVEMGNQGEISLQKSEVAQEKDKTLNSSKNMIDEGEDLPDINKGGYNHQEKNISDGGGDRSNKDSETSVELDNQLGSDNQPQSEIDKESVELNSQLESGIQPQSGNDKTSMELDNQLDSGIQPQSRNDKTSVELNSQLESDIQPQSGNDKTSLELDNQLESGIQPQSENDGISVKSEGILSDPKSLIGMKVVKINLSKVSEGYGLAKSFYCFECGKGFYLKHLLDKHESTCGTSSKRLKRKGDDSKGQKNKDTDQTYPCHMCDKEFASNGSRQRHMITHNDTLPFECNVCHKRFSQRITRKLHIERIHGSQPLYYCPVCKKRFKSMKDLQIHQAIHKGRQKYQCEYCDRSYYRKEEYNSHVSNKHPIERPFRCGGCMKGFLSANDVKFHSRTSSCREAKPMVLKLTAVDDDINE